MGMVGVYAVRKREVLVGKKTTEHDNSGMIFGCEIM